MNIEQALTEIATRYHLDTQALIDYAYDDHIGGYHRVPQLADWPIGSVWAVEGRILYALVRATRPEVVIQVGTAIGCSAAHIAAALKANGTGHLYAIDDSSDYHPPAHPLTGKPLAIGELIPEDLRDYITFVQEEAIHWLTTVNPYTPDIIFEDADHAMETTRDVWAYAKTHLNTAGFALSHDAAHFLVGEAIRASARRALATRS
jgi:predicted O-methyltransferase YrrM